MVLHTASADFLKQPTLRVQNLITEGYINILVSGISRENHQLSFDVLIIWFKVILSNLSGLKNWLSSCKMGEREGFHMTHTVHQNFGRYTGRDHI